MQGGFVYEKEPDQIRCPAGKILAQGSAGSKHKRYSSSASDCRNCKQSATCSAERRKGSDQRFIRRNVDQDLFEEVTTQMNDPTFKQRMSERMWKIEGMFAEAKDNHGLARAKYRGRGKSSDPSLSKHNCSKPKAPFVRTKRTGATTNSKPMKKAARNKPHRLNVSKSGLDYFVHRR